MLPTTRQIIGNIEAKTGRRRNDLRRSYNLRAGAKKWTNDELCKLARYAQRKHRNNERLFQYTFEEDTKFGFVPPTEDNIRNYEMKPPPEKWISHPFSALKPHNDYRIVPTFQRYSGTLRQKMAGFKKRYGNNWFDLVLEGEYPDIAMDCEPPSPAAEPDSDYETEDEDSDDDVPYSPDDIPTPTEESPTSAEDIPEESNSPDDIPTPTEESPTSEDIPEESNSTDDSPTYSEDSPTSEEDSPTPTDPGNDGNQPKWRYGHTFYGKLYEDEEHRRIPVARLRTQHTCRHNWATSKNYCPKCGMLKGGFRYNQTSSLNHIIYRLNDRLVIIPSFGGHRLVVDEKFPRVNTANQYTIPDVVFSLFRGHKIDHVNNHDIPSPFWTGLRTLSPREIPKKLNPHSGMVMIVSPTLAAKYIRRFPNWTYDLRMIEYLEGLPTFYKNYNSYKTKSPKQNPSGSSNRPSGSSSSSSRPKQSYSSSRPKQSYSSSSRPKQSSSSSRPQSKKPSLDFTKDCKAVKNRKRINECTNWKKLIFQLHPDKNKGCTNEATHLFKKFQSRCKDYDGNWRNTKAYGSTSDDELKK